jgi:polyisoprenoid-binding protein YceI
MKIELTPCTVCFSKKFAMKRLRLYGLIKGSPGATAILLFFSASLTGQPVFVAQSGSVSFYSHAPIEDITATTTEVSSVIDPSNGIITARVPVGSFAFKKQLMKKHFNEQYMVTDKYPSSGFTGKIEGDIENIMATGRQAVVRVTGDLTIKGITKQISETVTLVPGKNEMEGSGSFKVRLDDFGIRVPKMLIKNIAEEVEVSVKIVYKLSDRTK